MPRLTLLGSFSMDRGGPVTLRNKKAQALVAFLAMNPGVVHVRERLAALLWPDSHEDAARQSLRQCISMLRHDCAELPLSADHDLLGFDIGAVTTDVVEFKDAVSDPSIANLKRAAELYRGPFLEGLNARSDLFDEWLLGERTRLRAVATSAFHTLLQELQLIGAREEAIALALRLLAIDPLQEEVDCALMRLYSEQGQTALALRQYKRCEAILRKELNVEPDQETRALYQQLLRHRSQHRGPPGDVAAAEPAASPRQLKQNVRTCTARDGVRIAYASVGAGPPLVKAANWLNHLEFDFASPVWQHWIEALSRDNTFLRYDERGTGLSDWDVFDISFDAFVRDLETVVDAAGLERFPLLGISQGCAISIAYAVKHPERVSHLVLYGGYAKGWRHQDPSNVARREALPTLVLEGWGQESPVFRQIFTSLFIPEANAEQAQWFNDLQRITTSPQNAFKLTNIFGEIDVRHLLQDVRTPTLVLHARADASVKFTEGQELAARIKGATFVPLESPNHILLGTEPAWSVFLDSVRRFLAPDRCR
ncbi:DNA-binding SARP family transcriptional activator/pimeloyl-ACP methyl ester carboxylesterase [Bradyrhizobium japonicum]|nr:MULTISPECIES: alpha/beta hydrolase [Bradyrhizobium]MBR0880238.1 alpha/beta fold hydrolase [Bradyrhizobium liaoningense]MBR1000221.1 alpha/beta fold hydrolase [Bradyrhizobium liaoningense]MBR1030861.1 alpha/beta fold hydrolase [Bradyrhizobium liaoningense]MBR1066260.1 alpha/beta fold hydrolase [Bradyrhizobium liaoningense]MCP1742744.1 DNA-binding SARP family transcriptional activator/pimeloyl-ACP methyl ester carboxylesterase [Bradyrhizobium japonicum]